MEATKRCNISNVSIVGPSIFTACAFSLFVLFDDWISQIVALFSHSTLFNRHMSVQGNISFNDVWLLDFNKAISCLRSSSFVVSIFQCAAESVITQAKRSIIFTVSNLVLFYDTENAHRFTLRILRSKTSFHLSLFKFNYSCCSLQHEQSFSFAGILVGRFFGYETVMLFSHCICA